jgi:hypothetical protein
MVTYFLLRYGSCVLVCVLQFKTLKAKQMIKIDPIIRTFCWVVFSDHEECEGKSKSERD